MPRPLPSITDHHDTTRLIVTGDDFGISSRVNEAIERDFERGLLTHASLMVTGEKVDEACRIARRRPEMKIGLHLVLCAGRATAPSPFTDKAGNLVSSPLIAGLSYASCRNAIKWLQMELDAQMQRFKQLGFAFERWDGHCHMHLHPVVFRIASEILKEFKSVRLVYERKPETFTGAIFNILSRAAIPTLSRLGVQRTDQTLGLAHTGKMNTERFIRCLDRVTKGVETEIYYHPGADPEELNAEHLLSEIHQRKITLEKF
jgi:chitin disaccharide deacetylase